MTDLVPGRPATPSRPFAHRIVVQANLRDTDALGHVNNVVYLSWCELARTRYVLERRHLTDVAQVDFILASATLHWRSPVLLMEWVDVWCSPSRIGGKSWELLYEARARGDGRLVLEGSSVQVQFDYGTRRPIPVSADLRRLLEEDLAAFPVLAGN
jgi:acyl-CoA thioester hydrolase